MVGRWSIEVAKDGATVEINYVYVPRQLQHMPSKTTPSSSPVLPAAPAPPPPTPPPTPTRNGVQAGDGSHSKAADAGASSGEETRAVEAAAATRSRSTSQAKLHVHSVTQATLCAAAMKVVDTW